MLIIVIIHHPDHLNIFIYCFLFYQLNSLKSSIVLLILLLYWYVINDIPLIIIINLLQLELDFNVFYLVLRNFIVNMYQLVVIIVELNHFDDSYIYSNYIVISFVILYLGNLNVENIVVAVERI